MTFKKGTFHRVFAVLGLAAAFAAAASPARAAVTDEPQYILNSFSFLMTGALVMWIISPTLSTFLE